MTIDNRRTRQNVWNKIKQLKAFSVCPFDHAPSVQ